MNGKKRELDEGFSQFDNNFDFNSRHAEERFLVDIFKQIRERLRQKYSYSDDEIFAGDSGVHNHEIAMRNRFIKNVAGKIRNS